MTDNLPRRPNAGVRVCYAPLCEIGIGTGNAAVISQLGGHKVRFKLPSFKLIGKVACVECESLMYLDGLHRARLPDGRVVWIRDVREILEADPHFADDDAVA